MQVADLVSQLETARNAVVQLHTRLTEATKQQQAAACQQSRRMQQLEVQQAALNSRLDSMAFTISSSQDKNASAICNLRSNTQDFLTELISVVGQQFGKLQADLKQSQANEIKAEVRNALNGVCSSIPGASTSLLDQLVQRAVVDLEKQQLDVQIGRGVGDTAQDGMPSGTCDSKENGINNTEYASQDAALPDIGSGQAGHPAQKHASCAEPCKPGSNQDTAVGKGTTQALRPSAAGRLQITRSQDSLSLMHHASAAGSRTPTPPKSDSVRQRSSGQSPAKGRQALAEMDLNQPSTSLQTSPESAIIAQQRRQPAEQSGQQRDIREQQLYPKPVLQYSQPGMHRCDSGSKQNRQLRWADTARQLNQQLLQGSQPPATRSRTDANDLPNTADSGSDQMSGHGGGTTAIMKQDQTFRAEELQALPHMHNLTRTAQPQELHSLAFPVTAQNFTSGLDWKMPQSSDSRHVADTAANRSPSANHMPGYRQYASERLDLMQPPDTAPGLAVASYHASEFQQHAVRQPSVAQHDCSLAMAGSMHCQPGLHAVKKSDLSAGIPLTPLPVQQPQPRDSLEASIWKLSGGRRQQ